MYDKMLRLNKMAVNEHMRIVAKKLNMSFEQVKRIDKRGHNIDMLSKDGFVFDNDLREPLDEQLDTFAEASFCSCNDF